MTIESPLKRCPVSLHWYSSKNEHFPSEMDLCEKDIFSQRKVSSLLREAGKYGMPGYLFAVTRLDLPKEQNRFRLYDGISLYCQKQNEGKKWKDPQTKITVEKVYYFVVTLLGTHKEAYEVSFSYWKQKKFRLSNEQCFKVFLDSLNFFPYLQKDQKQGLQIRSAQKIVGGEFPRLPFRCDSEKEIKAFWTHCGEKDSSIV